LPITATGGPKQYAASDGTGNVIGKITDHGYEAEWMIFGLEGAQKKLPLRIWARLHPDLKNKPAFREFAIEVLSHFQAITETNQPIHDEISDSPAPYRSDADKPLYTLVASSEEGKCQWQKVFEWAAKDSPLTFAREHILIV
jgi:hypothetical protein